MVSVALDIRDDDLYCANITLNGDIVSAHHRLLDFGIGYGSIVNVRRLYQMDHTNLFVGPCPRCKSPLLFCLSPTGLFTRRP